LGYARLGCFAPNNIAAVALLFKYVVQHFMAFEMSASQTVCDVHFNIILNMLSITFVNHLLPPLPNLYAQHLSE